MENKSKLKKTKSEIPWVLPLRADVVIDHSFILKLPRELQYLSFLLMILLPVGIPFPFQLNPGSLQCPKISGHVWIKDCIRNALFIGRLHNYWQYSFIRDSKFLGSSSDPLEIRMHRERSLWS